MTALDRTNVHPENEKKRPEKTRKNRPQAKEIINETSQETTKKAASE
jgi:hypothetical protein